MQLLLLSLASSLLLPRFAWSATLRLKANQQTRAANGCSDWPENTIEFGSYAAGNIVEDSHPFLGNSPFTVSVTITPSAMAYGMLASSDRSGVGGNAVFRVEIMQSGLICVAGPGIPSAGSGFRDGDPDGHKSELCTPQRLQVGQTTQIAVSRDSVGKWTLCQDGASVDTYAPGEVVTHAFSDRRTFRIGSRFAAATGRDAGNFFQGTIEDAKFVAGVALECSQMSPRVIPPPAESAGGAVYTYQPFSLNFTWSTAVNAGWSSNQCDSLGRVGNIWDSLEFCRQQCAQDTSCTAFNFNSNQTTSVPRCEKLSCSYPIPSPAQNTTTWLWGSHKSFVDDVSPEVVYSFYNNFLQTWTIHFPPAWRAEEQRGVEFFAYRNPVVGTQPVYRFYNSNLGFYTWHFPPAWQGETQQEIEFYAYSEPVDGAQAVYSYWHNDEGKWRFHYAPEWAGESLTGAQGRGVQFFAQHSPLMPLMSWVQRMRDEVHVMEANLSHISSTVAYLQHAVGGVGSTLVGLSEHVSHDEVNMSVSNRTIHLLEPEGPALLHQAETNSEAETNLTRRIAPLEQESVQYMDALMNASNASDTSSESGGEPETPMEIVNHKIQQLETKIAFMTDNGVGGRTLSNVVAQSDRYRADVVDKINHILRTKLRGGIQDTRQALRNLAGNITGSDGDDDDDEPAAPGVLNANYKAIHPISTMSEDVDYDYGF